MATTRETNASNARLRPDGKGGLTDKSNTQTKRQKALTASRGRRPSARTPSVYK